MENNSHIPTLVRPQPQRLLINGRGNNRRKGQPYRRHPIYNPFNNYSTVPMQHQSRDTTLNYIDDTARGDLPLNLDMLTYALEMTGRTPFTQRHRKLPENRNRFGLEALRHFILDPFQLTGNTNVPTCNFMFNSPYEIYAMMNQAYSHYNEHYRYNKDVQVEIDGVRKATKEKTCEPMNVEDMDESEQHAIHVRFETTQSEDKTESEPSPFPRFQCPNCKSVFNYQATMMEHVQSHCGAVNDVLATEDALENDLSTESDVDVDVVDSDTSTQSRNDEKDDDIDPNIPLDLRMESRKTSATGNKDNTVNETLAETNIDSEGFQDCSNTPKLPTGHFPQAGSFTESTMANERYLHRRLRYFQGLVPRTPGKLPSALSLDDYRYLETRELYHGNSNLIPLQEIHDCHICSKQFNSRVNLHRHKATHTEVNPFSCEVYDKTFSNQSNKLFHIALQAGDKTYSCYYCSKTYASKNQLKDHLVKHTGQKSYKCAFCDVAFGHRFSLRQHLLLKHPQGQIDPLKNDEYRPFTCDICFKKFTQLSSLKTHKRLHSGIKPFCCPVCWKCFPRKDTLTRHQYRHATERPFKCDRCEKSFATRYMLKQHSAGHLFEKRCDSYVCKVCGLDLGSRQKLSQHVKVHDASELRVVK